MMFKAQYKKTCSRRTQAILPAEWLVTARDMFNNCDVRSIKICRRLREENEIRPYFDPTLAEITILSETSYGENTMP
jgi:hypothetical protein